MRYVSHKPDQAPLRLRIHDLAAAQVRYGCFRIYILLRREGWLVNHKRVYRLYREDGLSLRLKRPRRNVSAASALHYKRFPRKQLFALKAGHGALTAEIERLMGMSPTERPVGRLAVVRQELATIDAELVEAEVRLRPVDVNVLRAILSFMCGKTGRMFPSGEEIAARAICCVKRVWRSLARLRHHGFIDRIRRSRKKADCDGHFGPQREQTSHAYFLNHRRTMGKRIYQRFIQLREMRWKRLGKNTPVPSPAVTEAPQAILRGNSPLADAIHRLGISVSNASP